MFVCDFGGFLPRLLLKSVSRPSFFSFTAASKFHLVQPHSKAGQHRETHPHKIISMYPISAVDHNNGQFFRAREWLMFFFQATIDFNGFSMVLTTLDHHH